MPEIAIVIPAHNRARVLPRALASVLGGADDVEVVVVDDASSDDTATVLTGLADRRLRHERLERRRNGNVARNRGIAATRAPIVAFLDSDDEFLAGRAARLVSYFADNPGVAGVADGFQVMHRGAMTTESPPALKVGGEALRQAVAGHAFALSCSAIAVRRPVLEAVGGFDEALVRQQDRDLLLRLAQDHLVALGTGRDVIKHQEHDSISRVTAGYVDGLEALVSRHAVFLRPENRALLGYLSVRSLIRGFFAGEFSPVLAEAAALARARHLPGLVESVLAYPGGKRVRRQARDALRLAAARA